MGNGVQMQEIPVMVVETALRLPNATKHTCDEQIQT